LDFRWESTPDPAGGAYSAPADPLTELYLRGLLLWGREGNREAKERARQGGLPLKLLPHD